MLSQQSVIGDEKYGSAQADDADGQRLEAVATAIWRSLTTETARRNGAAPLRAPPRTARARTG
jgi:hypothetical protein